VTPRDAARAILDSALAAGDVTPLVRRHLGLDARHRRVVVLGCGKASAAMTAAAEEVLGDRLAGGFAVVKDGCAVPVPRVEIAEAGHPVPDNRGLAASARLLELAHAAVKRISCSSSSRAGLGPDAGSRAAHHARREAGGHAAAPGLRRDDRRAERRPQAPVALQGGAARPRRLAGERPDARALRRDRRSAGRDRLRPTAPDPTTFADAREVLTRRGLAGRVPVSVAARLEAGLRGEIEETRSRGIVCSVGSPAW